MKISISYSFYLRMIIRSERHSFKGTVRRIVMWLQIANSCTPLVSVFGSVCLGDCRNMVDSEKTPSVFVDINGSF